MASISTGLAAFVEQEVNKLVKEEIKPKTTVSKSLLKTVAVASDDKLAGLIQSEVAGFVVDEIVNKVRAKKVFRESLKNKSKYEFVNGTAHAVNQVNLKLTQKGFTKKIESIVSARDRKVKYNRIAKRQINIYANQIKTDGIKVANEKLKNRTKNIIMSEKGYYNDQGKMYGAKEINRNTNKTAVKKWVHGMYGTPKDARDTHAFADGQYAMVDGYFYVSGQQVKAPREFADIAENINCHCGIEIEIY